MTRLTQLPDRWAGLGSQPQALETRNGRLEVAAPHTGRPGTSQRFADRWFFESRLAKAGTRWQA